MKSDDECLMIAIGKWLSKLDQVPGWREWKKKVTSTAYWFDDNYLDTAPVSKQFTLPTDLDRERAVIECYLALHSTLASLRDCEYYFRRFPFRGMPISKHDHLRHICEMYFSHFYEFKTRLSECLNAVNAILDQSNKLKMGVVIKAFSKEFDQEIRERNNIHHHNRFEDLALDNLFLTALPMEDEKRASIHNRRHNAAYRRASNEWATRVVHRTPKIENYLNGVAGIILANCPFVACFVNASASDE